MDAAGFCLGLGSSVTQKADSVEFQCLQDLTWKMTPSSLCPPLPLWCFSRHKSRVPNTAFTFTKITCDFPVLYL